MKVREMIEALQKLDPELEVFKSKDDEGNGYSPVYGADGDCIVVDDDGEYVCYDPTATAEDNCFDDDEETLEEWEELKKGPRTVVIY